MLHYLYVGIVSFGVQVAVSLHAAKVQMEREVDVQVIEIELSQPPLTKAQKSKPSSPSKVYQHFFEAESAILICIIVVTICCDLFRSGCESGRDA